MTDKIEIIASKVKTRDQLVDAIRIIKRDGIRLCVYKGLNNYSSIYNYFLGPKEMEDLYKDIIIKVRKLVLFEIEEKLKEVEIFFDETVINLDRK